MSIPRDLMTHVPQCTKPDGSTVGAKFEQFNWAFEAGGAACTIRAVEEMTGVRIDHHLTVDFSGFKNMVNAVDGVEVCVAEPVHDVQAHLDLPAGRQKLDGEQALGYVRARHSLGDGSDTERIQRQQDFLASLVKKVQSNGVLLNPAKIYPLLNAATKSLTADPGLASLSDLYKLAQSLQKIPTGSIHFLTVPQEPYVADHNRDQLVRSKAEPLFAALRADQPVNVTGDLGRVGFGRFRHGGRPALRRREPHVDAVHAVHAVHAALDLFTVRPGRDLDPVRPRHREPVDGPHVPGDDSRPKPLRQGPMN